MKKKTKAVKRKVAKRPDRFAKIAKAAEARADSLDVPGADVAEQGAALALREWAALVRG